jgi:hypothetical protein
MTVQRSNIVSPQPSYVFWLATWHNLPFPLGELRCCRITPYTLEIDISPETRWSIPISRILHCKQHIQHDGIHGLYLYACLTVEQTQITTLEHAIYDIYLGALDPVTQSWDWAETMNLIALISSLMHQDASPIHPNPYWRAFARYDRLADFTQRADEWDPLTSPQTYVNHPLMKDIRSQATTAIGLPLLSVLLSIGLGVTIVLFWRGATLALIEVGLAISILFGLFGLAYRKTQQSAHLLKEYLSGHQAEHKLIE